MQCRGRHNATPVICSAARSICAAPTRRRTPPIGSWRRRPIPELGGRTVQQRQRGERLAVNTVIQGSAADIMKAGMVQAHADLRDAGLAARLVLQIHDELLVEAPEDEAARAGEIVRAAMVGAFVLDPPLVVDVGRGHTWLEAK